MTFSTAWKINGICLIALAAEAVLAYFLFSNYAFSLAETGRYANAEAYASGPMGNLATLFYVMFGLTIAVAMGSLLAAFTTRMIHHAPRD